MLQCVICFKLKLPLKRPRYIYLIVYIMSNICQHPPGLQFYFYKVSIMLLSYSDGTVLFIFVPKITSSILGFLYFIVFVQKSFNSVGMISALSDMYRCS